MEFFGSLLWPVLMILGGGVFALYIYQRWMVYVPFFPGNARNVFEKPDDYGISQEAVSNITFSSADGEHLHAFLIKHPKSIAGGARLPVFFYLHENAGNLSHRYPNIKAILDRLEVNVFILSYRGYGDSSGLPSEAGLVLDSLAALRWYLFKLHETSSPIIDRNNIILFGRSLGGAVALALAAELNRTEFNLKIRALILENTFVNVPELMSHLMPLISGMSTLVTNPWHSDTRVLELDPQLPVLFISGGSDELIPPPMMKTLYEKCQCVKKEFAHFPGGSHMGTWEEQGYWAAMIQFLAKHLKHKS